MKVDIKRILKASLIFMGAGLVLVILRLILQLLSILIDSSHGEIMQFIYAAFIILSMIIFPVMLFYAGMRAVKAHGLDAVGAGLVALASYVVAALAHLFFDSLLSVLVVSGIIPGGATSGSEWSVISAAIFDMAGISAIGVAAVCGFAYILVGALINFVIGGFGGLYTQR